MGQAMPEEEIKPILEINPTHKITKKLSKMDIKTDEFKNIWHLLLGQAMLAEGIKPNNIIHRLYSLLVNMFLFFQYL